MAKRKKEKEADMRSDGLKQLSNIICATPAKKRGKKFNEMVDVTALLATITRGVELCSQGGSVEQFKEIILDMRRACEKSVQYMTFRDFMSGDVHKGASRLGYKMKLRNLKPMEVNPSAGLVDHLRKVSDNVIMDVESARELLIYPIMVEAVSEVPDVFLRVQPELSAELKVDGVTTVISGNPDMTAGTLKLEGSPTKAHLRNFLKHGFASIREHFCLGEWKRSSEFDEGQGQLFAQMAAARAKSSSKVPAVVNGLLADGDRFIFSTLEGDTFYVSDIFERGTNLGQIIAYLRVAMSGKPLPAVGKYDSSSPLTVPSPPSSDAGYPQSPHDSSVFTAAPVPLNYGKTSKRKKESKEKKTKIDTSLIKTEPKTKRTNTESKSKSKSTTKTEPESKTKRIKTEPETKRIKIELETKRTKKERN